MMSTEEVAVMTDVPDEAQRWTATLTRCTATSVMTRPNRPQPVPSKRTDLGCKMVARDRFGGLAEGTKSKKSLQINGGSRRVRTGDVRRAKAETVLPIAAVECRRVRL